MTRTLPSHIRKRKHPNPPHPITDHAIVRFIARTGVLDISKLRAYLYTKGLKAACKESREHQITMYYQEQGLDFTICKGMVVTVIPIDMLKRPKH